MNTELVKKISGNSIAKAIIIAGIVIAVAFVYINVVKAPKGGSPNNQNVISAQDAAKKAIDYINQNVLAGKFTASLVGVVEENGVYSVKFKIQDQEINSYISKNGSLLFLEGIDLTKPQPSPVTETGQTIGGFSVSNDEICKENGKPVVYFFGSNSCPHCLWEHPIVTKVMDQFKDLVSFHNNMDSKDDQDILKKYSTGGIPTIVLGCKYYRVGSGENSGEEAETKALTALLCKLTGSNQDACTQVQDLINQIKD